LTYFSSIPLYTRFFQQPNGILNKFFTKNAFLASQTRDVVANIDHLHPKKIGKADKTAFQREKGRSADKAHLK